MSRATESILANLHGKIADHLIKKIESGEATAAELATAVKFLKDNGVNVEGGDDPALNSIAEGLPENIDGVVPFYGSGTG